MFCRLFFDLKEKTKEKWQEFSITYCTVLYIYINIILDLRSPLTHTYIYILYIEDWCLEPLKITHQE
jgi:hypothetical protein